MYSLKLYLSSNLKDYGDVVHRLTSDDDLNDIDFPAKPEPPAPEPMD